MKKEISINPSEIKRGLGAMYDFNGLKLTFCTPPNRKGQIKVVHYFDSCRETVAGFLRVQLENKEINKPGPAEEAEKIDLRKARLILFAKSPSKSAKTTTKKFSERKDKEIAIGLKLVNHYEKKLGWLLTKITKLNNNRLFKDSSGTDIDDSINMYMVIGTNKWIKSPCLLSLYMLLLRLGTRHFEGNFKTHKQLFEELKVFISKCVGNYERQKDIEHVRATHDKWDILLDNYSKLFGNKPINRFYCKKYLINNCSGFNEGITRLCSGYSRDLEFSNKFIELCKSKGVIIEYRVKIEKNKKEM